MSYTLYTGQILETLRGLGHPNAEAYIDALQSLTESAADALAQALDINRGELSELWDDNVAVSFRPKYEGQPLPDAIRGMDTETEWEEEQ